MTSYYVRETGGNDGNDGLSHANAWATISNAMSSMTTGQPNRLNISGTHVGAVPVSTYGSPAVDNPLHLVGYTSVEGDGGVATLDGNGAMIFNDTNFDYLHGERLTFKNWGGSWSHILDNSCCWVECLWDAEGARAVGYHSDNDVKFFRCSFVNFNLSGSSVCSCLTGGQYDSCYFHSAGSSGTILDINSRSSLRNSVISVDSTSNIAALLCSGSNTVVSNNVIFSQLASTGKGLSIASLAHDNVSIMNNIIAGFSGAGGVGINTVAGCTVQAYGGNKFWNNTTDTNFIGNVTLDLGGNAVLASNPFKSTGNASHWDDDFELSDAELGFAQQLWDGGTGNFGTRNETYRDVGALVREYTGGGGGDEITLAPNKLIVQVPPQITTIFGNE